uniref:PD-(D/E)XK nuclease family protein n=1 Tax=Actibacterium sp. TaxID=1872125 RepID=UPI00356B2668
QWLITCAAGDLDNGNSWYERVAEGMTRSGATAHMFEGGQGLRLQVGDWTQAAPDQDQAAEAPPAPLPTWATTACAAPEHPPQLLSPSDLGGAKALPGEGGLTEDEAKLRGSRLHLLLEHLPDADPASWPDLARKILPDTPDADRAALFAEAKTVLTAPDLQHLFDPSALAEVAFTADLPGLSAPIHGIIDRLILTPDRVLALDYKSNAQIPGSPDAVPEGILRQMGAYAAALARIYPDRSIETAILWTSAAQLMPLPSQLVADALARATTS